LGQIFERIKRVTKSYLNDEDSSPRRNYTIPDEDDELKKIIDELGKDKSRSESGNQQTPRGKGSGTLDRDKALSVLGLSSKAGIDEIKSAYRKKMMEYHPDRVSGLGKDLQEIARKKAIEINLAYEFLGKTMGFN
jgi:DnaJ-domain-containing protein 1